MPQYQSLIFGIDTSCDETSMAILADGKKVLAHVISSQIKLHQPHGGVVPELASRCHIESLQPVMNEALGKAGISFKDITGIAVTASPGLIGCILVGLSYAKSLAYALQIPLTTVHHLKAHLFSPFLEYEEVYPFLGLVVSGGHTALYYVERFDKIKCFGQTVDDAAGEAFDKVAKLLGLGYPGGPQVDRLAQLGDPKAFSFTRARVKKGFYYMSFSGLKTAVLQLVKNEKGGPMNQIDHPEKDSFICNMAASFQNEVIESIVSKIERALDEYPVQAVLVSGGVAVNSGLRKRMGQLSEKTKVFIPSPLLCTDNGAMIAYVGSKQLEKGIVAGLDCNAYASAPMW